MNSVEIGILAIVGLAAICGTVVVLKLAWSLSRLALSGFRLADRERIDGDRLIEIFMEKVAADRESAERLASLHASESFRKWKLTGKDEQLKQAELDVAVQNFPVEAGVGPDDADAHE